MQITGYASKGFYSASAAQAYGSGGTSAAAAKTAGGGGSAATVVTLSEAAKAASAEPGFAEVVTAAREMLNTLLSEAERGSPLQDGKLALDLSRLSQRQLHAISSTADGLFTSDERKGADLEMERRFAAALTGSLAVSEVSGDYRNLYKAAAEYFDGLSPEQKAEPEWKAGRAAIDKALAALEGDRKTLPTGIADDPVAAWMATRKEEADASEGSETLGENLRKILDKRYDAAWAEGKSPTFDKARPGEFIDLAEFDSRSLSAMALNREGLFSAQEVRAADAEIKARANLALSEGYKSAADSGDPTAFSRNIIAIYSSMSADERAAAGFSENLLNTAIESYESSARLMEIMATGMNAMGGMQSWFGR